MVWFIHSIYSVQKVNNGHDDFHMVINHTVYNLNTGITSTLINYYFVSLCNLTFFLLSPTNDPHRYNIPNISIPLHNLLLSSQPSILQDALCIQKSPFKNGFISINYNIYLFWFVHNIICLCLSFSVNFIVYL